MATRVVENTYVLIAADAGSRHLVQVMDSRAMEIVRTPANRHIQTLDLAGSPLPKTYVKVGTEGSNRTVNSALKTTHSGCEQPVNNHPPNGENGGA